MAKKKVINAYDFKDKERCIETYLNYMFNRTVQMFEYTGLPEGIDPRMLELRLQRGGSLVLTKIKKSDIRKQQGADDIDIPEGIYAFEGNPAGVMDFNGNPSFTVIAHPRLTKSMTLKAGEDCVIMRNDTNWMGLLPLFRRYATQLVENDITMTMADIESRIISLIVAGDTNTIEGAKQFLADVEAGKMGVIGDKGFDELFKLQTLPFTTTANNSLTNLIEYQQYVKASWFNEMGLSANYNMKRESINSSEAQLGQESLLPLIDDMLHCRQKALDELNRIYGTNASVDFHSGWKDVEDGIIQDAEVVSEETPGGDGHTMTSEPDSMEASDDSSAKSTHEDDYQRNLDKRARRGNI